MAPCSAFAAALEAQFALLAVREELAPEAFATRLRLAAVFAGLSCEVSPCQQGCLSWSSPAQDCGRAFGEVAPAGNQADLASFDLQVRLVAQLPDGFDDVVEAFYMSLGVQPTVSVDGQLAADSQPSLAHVVADFARTA